MLIALNVFIALTITTRFTGAAGVTGIRFIMIRGIIHRGILLPGRGDGEVITVGIILIIPGVGDIARITPGDGDTLTIIMVTEDIMADITEVTTTDITTVIILHAGTPTQTIISMEKEEAPEPIFTEVPMEEEELRLDWDQMLLPEIKVEKLALPPKLIVQEEIIRVQV